MRTRGGTHSTPHTARTSRGGLPGTCSMYTDKADTQPYLLLVKLLEWCHTPPLPHKRVRKHFRKSLDEACCVYAVWPLESCAHLLSRQCASQLWCCSRSWRVLNRKRTRVSCTVETQRVRSAVGRLAVRQVLAGGGRVACGQTHSLGLAILPLATRASRPCCSL